MNSISKLETPTSVQGKSVASVLQFCVAQVFMALYWPLGVVFILILSLITGIFLNQETHRKLGQRTLGTSLGLFIRGLEFLGIIRVSDEDLKKHAEIPGPLIIACNHPALWDAPLVMRRFVWVTCIMKEELLENPFLKSGARFAGFIPNSPRLHMIQMALERLKNGGRLLLFPEGTRTREENGAVNPFLPGVALLAKQSSTPILPVFISSNSRYLQKGWPIWKMPDLPISISIRVGKQVQIQSDENVRNFSERLEEIFRKELS